MQSKPTEIHWLNVHWSQVAQFLVFGFLLVGNFFASDANYVLILISLFPDQVSPTMPGVMLGADICSWSLMIVIFFVSSVLLPVSVGMLSSLDLAWWNSPPKRNFDSLPLRQKRTKPTKLHLKNLTLCNFQQLQPCLEKEGGSICRCDRTSGNS